MSKQIYGPNYAEMFNPQTLPSDVLKAVHVAKEDEFDPLNLFNITWRKADGTINKIVIPKAFTGVDANIVVLLGKDYPSGSHKVGPAYSTLIEGLVDGDIEPGKHKILGPSTGNFGIGVSYVCHLLNFDATVIMPDNMSKERYERIKAYGANLTLTPGTESDVILTLQKTHEMAQDPLNYSLAQFELLPNYRFHRHVTGQSIVEAVAGIGNGRVASFVSAPGSAGTLAAGDHLKTTYPEVKITAVEPYECATLTNKGKGQHRIEGIGDKMCTLIHNVLNTDFITLIKDEHAVRILKIWRDAHDVLEAQGIPKTFLETYRDAFGVSGFCNILGAIKMAKHLKLGPSDNIVTIATDGFDRYDSVIEAMKDRYLELEPFVFKRWYQDIVKDMSTQHILDTRHQEEKDRLFKQKEDDWLPFGYDKTYLEHMKNPAFWEKEYQKVHHYNEKIIQKRKKAGYEF